MPQAELSSRAATVLLGLLLARMGERAGEIEVVECVSVDWASPLRTLTGERHSIVLRLADEAAADLFSAGLSDAEFDMMSGLVVDIEFAGRAACGRHVDLLIAALTIEE